MFRILKRKESHTSSVPNSTTNDKFTIFNDDDNEKSDDNCRAIQNTSNIRCLNRQSHQHHLLHQSYKLSFYRFNRHEIRL